MIRTLIFKAVIVLILVIMSGCVVKSSQLSGLLEQFDEQSVDFSDNSWLLTYGGYKSVVYAVEVPQGILFTNSFGDAVVFDGWTIESIKGMGRRQINLNVEDRSQKRFFYNDNRIVATHDCKSWQKEARSGMIQYSHVCSSQGAYSNTILVDKKGSISVIRQVIDQRLGVVTLSKIN
ncbi:MAG: hypothetical protein P8Q37_07330 [Porticoccaceae bacterium]|nr:hypothetical protein [Porticoccaceae bacterium]MDG1474701.1 hypothetical protein [Porticoccaceae bacterium]